MPGVFSKARLAEMTERYAGGEIELPPHWGGYRIVPATIEFWQGRANRLHDRFRYTATRGRFLDARAACAVRLGPAVARDSGAAQRQRRNRNLLASKSDRNATVTVKTWCGLDPAAKNARIIALIGQFGDAAMPAIFRDVITWPKSRVVCNRPGSSPARGPLPSGATAGRFESWKNCEETAVALRRKM